ncbi:MAG: PEP/pyruvate-binding domain-containing protein [Chlamydiota bacterium]
MFKLHTFADLHSLSTEQIRRRFGGKLLGLYEADRLGINIPRTLMIGTDVHQAFLETDPSRNLEEFRQRGAAFLEKNLPFHRLDQGRYAIRSSAQGEDSSQHSFAGIFETKLDTATDQIAAAIAFVWSSPLLEKAVGYGNGNGCPLMGVLIQPMIEGKSTGICFTGHPSPKSIFDNDQWVVEFAETSGDKVVGGEVTPHRLCGSPDILSAATDKRWIDTLLLSSFELKKHYRHQVDIEFAIDRHHTFWLLQQRPITKVYRSKTLDLSHYRKMYKRSLLQLDVELLIDGCSRFLAPYLEVPICLERWMVMITNNDGIQELWVHKVLNETVLRAIIDKIEHDPTYLSRIERRYRDHHRRLIGAQPTDLFAWFEWIAPFTAHYYVPMFIIDALYRSVLPQMRAIDPENAEKDLFNLSTSGIASLTEQLNSKLLALKHLSFEQCAPQLQQLAERFGFIKCRQPFEDPYSPQELFEMIGDVPETVSGQEKGEHHYFRHKHLTERFTHLREWMRIRNQEMEYLLFAFLKGQPMIRSISNELSISDQTFWHSSKNSLLRGKPIQVDNPTIVQVRGQTTVSDQIEIHFPNPDTLSDLKGSTIYGNGTLEATVCVAFSPEELTEPPRRPCVLVTGMTTPDFIPLIRKHFDALITDEGGILCHAAIIAREIPIPCIVGTGSASDHLKNGMRVSMDFDRGEIIRR